VVNSERFDPQACGTRIGASQQKCGVALKAGGERRGGAYDCAYLTAIIKTLNQSAALIQLGEDIAAIIGRGRNSDAYVRLHVPQSRGFGNTQVARADAIIVSRRASIAL